MSERDQVIQIQRLIIQTCFLDLFFLYYLQRLHGHSVISVFVFRQWLGYAFAVMFILIAIFMVLTRFISEGCPVDEVKVLAPPPMNKMEQLLAVQNAISQAEGFIQDGNVVLLKIRALWLSIFPQVLFLCLCSCSFVPLPFISATSLYSMPLKTTVQDFK